MGKKNKSKRGSRASRKAVEHSTLPQNSPNEPETKKQPSITMKDLEQMSDGSESEQLPPPEEWDDEAKALKDMILGGKFDHLLKREDGGGEEDNDDDSIEEVELNSDIEKEDEEEADEASASDDEQEEDIEQQGKDQKELDSQENNAESDAEQAESDSEKDEGEVEKDGQEGGDDDSIKDNDDDEKDNKKAKHESIETKNQVSSKALHLVTQELLAEKKGWHWAERFDVVPSTPLPFGPGNPLDIHDDLKREVAFYDMALEAVQQGRAKCQEAGIPFSRPEDFFAEMVKSDDHMARVKDLLVFSTKKMDAVAQRRSNKEQKLRSKETQANKLAEKAKRKKDHFQAVQDWAASAASQRNDQGGSSGKNNKSNNKKRQMADQKYGFGGKKGRFKQNDPKSMNDLSSYNPRGNFAGGMKRTPPTKNGSGAGRKGKRARDASRSRK